MAKERKVRLTLGIESTRKYPATQACVAQIADSSHSCIESTFLELVVRGRDNEIYEDAFLTDSGLWEVWGSLGGTTWFTNDVCDY